MSRKSLPVNVYKYHDYRIFLYDLFTEWKKKVYKLSYRKFSEMAGFSSPNMLKLIIDGKRNLSPANISKLVKTFDFNKQESDFFENLVKMNQAKTHSNKNFYYKKLNKTPRYKLLRKGDKNLYEFYSKWYYPVIRELVTTVDFNESPEWISKRVYPTITESEARKAMEVLVEMGHIYKDEDKWKQREPLATTGPQITSLAVANYHENMIGLGKDSVENVPGDKRNISSLTLAISPKSYEILVKELESIQQRIIDLANEETSPEQVYQVNFQVFPVSSFPSKENEK